jgi:hypothetical protein
MSPPQAVLDRGGYARHSGAWVTPRTRLLRLIALFWNDYFARHNARAALALAAVTTLLAAAVVLVRGQFAWVAVAPPEQAAFVLATLATTLSVLSGIVLWHAAARIAPLIAEDAHHGALLLYFTRPVDRHHYLLARLVASVLGTAVLVAAPLVVVGLVLVSQFGWHPGGCPWPTWAGGLWWLAVLLAAIVAALVMAVALAMTALAAGLLVRAPSAAPLAMGGAVLASVAVSWVLQAVYGRQSLARSLDLHHALQAPWTLLSWLLEPATPPRVHLHDAGGGLLLWLSLAVAAGWLLQRFIARPPLGKGRSG